MITLKITTELRRLYVCVGFCVSLLSISCVAPKDYHPQVSVFQYQFPMDEDCYFAGSRAYEAFIELDEEGKLYKESDGTPRQVVRAINLIHDLKATAKAQSVIVVVFVHGWKNNASDASGNMWGFRRILDEIAYQAPEPKPPVIGIYVGWPGASARVGKFFTFWNRQGVADTIGTGEIDGVLERILKETKGERFDGPSYAVLVGHSFGGLIMEKAAIRILKKYIDSVQETEFSPPADLMVLLNEAGPATQARDFLLFLMEKKISYELNGQPRPLLLSMTSTGDLATKLAFPGGQAISSKKPKKWGKYPQPDPFGFESNQPYYYLTAGNFVALQSHEILESTSPSALIRVPDVGGRDYFVVPKTSAPNTTPYWIMQIPQVFVPDHGSIFRTEVISLLRAFLSLNRIMPEQTKRRPTCPRGTPPAALVVAPPTRPVPGTTAERPKLRKTAQ